MTLKAYPINPSWGFDYSFVLAFLVRFNLIATDQELFYKRMVRDIDDENTPAPIVIKDPSKHIFPFKRSIAYIREHLKAVRHTGYTGIVLFIMLLRMPVAIRNRFTGRTRSILRRMRTTKDSINSKQTSQS